VMDDLRLRVYLSNQMSRKAEHNFPWFKAVAVDLRRQGIWVLPPNEIMHGETQHFNDGWTHQDYVNADIAKMLRECNAIAVGPDWQYSEGSRREVSVALLAGWPVYKVKEWHSILRPVEFRLELV